MNKTSLALTLSLLLAVFCVQAEYPDKPVTFIVPWPPGDLEDLLTRMIADEFQLTYGVAAAVVNKPGGGGGPFPGAISVATAPADGYTVGSFNLAVPVIGPTIGIAELNPNPFAPIGNFLTYPFVIVANASAPYDDFAGLAEHARSNEVVLGHFGAPLIPTKVTLALASKMNFTFTSNAAFDALDCNTLASGDVDVMNTTLQLILPCLNEVKVLASITGTRISRLPDTPVVTELAPDLDISLWNGLFVRKGTPAIAISKIRTVAMKVMKSDKAVRLAEQTGALVYWQDVDQVYRQIERDKASLSRINQILQ